MARHIHGASVLALSLFPTLASAGPFDWERLERAVNTYQAAPSADTAGAIRKVIPAWHVSYEHSRAETSALNAVERLLPTLLTAVRSGDGIAVGVCFDLQLVADGGLLEDIWGGLSEIIPRHPVVFLEHLSTREDVAPKLLTFMGQRFVDQDRSVRCGELRERERALAGVTRKDLSGIRNRCLGALAAAVRECA